MKKREKLSGIELSTICRQLKLESADGKLYKTDVADTKQLFRQKKANKKITTEKAKLITKFG